jgi:class 3 adenylate cyclase
MSVKKRRTPFTGGASAIGLVASITALPHEDIRHMSEPSSQAQAVLAWLLGGGRRIIEPNAFLEALAAQLLSAGVPITRITTGVPILHPKSVVVQRPVGSGQWHQRAPLPPRCGGCGREPRKQPDQDRLRGGGPVRCDPQHPIEGASFPILADLRQAGITDYAVLGAPFSDGSTKAVSLATNHPQRFSEADIALFEATPARRADHFAERVFRRDDAGGEILKFIGDAMLAIFPIDVDAEATCVCALAAATEARAAMTRINAERSAAGQPTIDFGIALHLGDVMYGNIGGESRLDFTVIGPAVNLATRIQGLCGELRRPLLVSEAFARSCGSPVDAVGEFSLKGFGATQPVFAPRDR